ncbi:hypothetical protein MKEN_00461300 [Mycena kentingensis (nom. inval.)]|nr:hypothetical protein MKEN_00461300 [Mycena kentingensis (nom. inval.)]
MSPTPTVDEFYSVVNATKIYIACTTSILIWDWLSCLPQEYKHIWKHRSWSPIKFLYCMVRYYTLAVLIVTDVWFFASWSEAACSRYVRILPGIAVLIDLSIEAVLAIRIYALYACDRRMAVALGVMLAAFLGVMIAVPILAFTYTPLPIWPGACIVTGQPSIAGPKFIIAFYAAPMTCDVIMTALTLFRAIDQNKRGGSSSLMRRMVRDGLFYFFAITSLNLLNVIFFVQSDELIQAINAPMSIQISSVLCCRLILNLRAENEPSTSVKKFSHSRNRWVTDIIHDSSVVGNPLRFSQNPELGGGGGGGGGGGARRSDIVIRLQHEVNTDTYADAESQWKAEEDSDVDVGPEEGSNSMDLPELQAAHLRANNRDAPV